MTGNGSQAAECCGKCKFYRMSLDNMNDWVCKRKPPTLFLFPAGPGNVKQVPMYPPQRKNDWCGEYKAKLDIANLNINE